MSVRGCRAVRPGRRLPGTLVLVLALGAGAVPLQAKELLAGSVPRGEREALAFSLSGENLKDVVGGSIVLGADTFEITRVSRTGMVGARRLVRSADGQHLEYGEFVVFSSSYSEQTAVGQPWVAARSYLACDSDYNSFLAVYRVRGEARVRALSEIPYPALTENLDASDDSTVYCFMSRKAFE